jgi:hypothetical protein
MANAGTDKGYTFHGPTTIDRTMPLKNRLTLETNRQAGIVVSETPGSPLHHATLFAQGTTVRDAEGAIVCDARLYEFTGPEGDSAWAIGVNWPGSEAATFRLVQGTGRWEGLGGTFKTLGMTRERADDHSMLRWEACWEVDADRSWDYDALVAAGDYTDYDTGYSFHGPHVVTKVKELANGQLLSANTQAGVLLSETEHSPRHNATCYDRGTTIKTPDGKALGDIMLLEDTDADGDVVWLYHEWWYGKGPGRYEFLGGMGKWAGIAGVGKTLGMVCSRADDHYMPTWEMRWKIQS